jgi:hypothetical protein
MNEWAAAIAVGPTELVENVKADRGIGARHRDIDVAGTTRCSAWARSRLQPRNDP